MIHRCLTVILFALPTLLLAHPFAVTLAEAEYDADRKVIEVALRVYPEQLERALSLAAGQIVDLARTKDVDARITDYLTTHFTFTSARSRNTPPSAIMWVGKEVSTKEVWLYFEIPSETDPAGKTLTNTLLFEANPEQLNIVNIKVGDRVATSVTTRQQPTSAVRFDAKKPNPLGRRQRLDF